MNWLPIVYGVGIGILLSVAGGSIVGLFGVAGSFVTAIVLFLLTYVPAGYFAAVFNPSHPYAASSLAGGLLAVINQFVTILFLNSGVLADTVILVMGMILGMLCALGGGLLAALKKNKHSLDEV